MKEKIAAIIFLLIVGLGISPDIGFATERPRRLTHAYITRVTLCNTFVVNSIGARVPLPRFLQEVDPPSWTLWFRNRKLTFASVLNYTQQDCSRIRSPKEGFEDWEFVPPLELGENYEIELETGGRVYLSCFPQGKSIELLGGIDPSTEIRDWMRDYCN